MSVVAVACVSAILATQTYVDSRGNKVEFHLGAVSFADEVTSFKNGAPPAADSRWSDPALVLGVPDYISAAVPKSLTLGCAGELVVRFADNALVDVSGPDLYIFEAGPAVEPTALAISTDGERWVEVGRVAGGVASADIAPLAQPGDVFRYVRLTDLRSACAGRFPGADIDAIGAIGSALQLSLAGSVLFDSGQSTLKPEAREALDAIVPQIGAFPGAAVLIEGHTDSVGSSEANQALSDARAASVRSYLSSVPALSGFAFESRGHGELRPIASNETEEGRERNRRVEIVVTPR